MGRLLAALLADSTRAPLANPANPANPVAATLARFADSQDSQASLIRSAADPKAIRDRLHAIAATAGVHRTAVDAIDANELSDYGDLHDDTLRDLLRLRGGCSLCCPVPNGAAPDAC